LGLREFGRALDDFNNALNLREDFEMAHKGSARAYIGLGKNRLIQSKDYSMMDPLSRKIFHRFPGNAHVTNQMSKGALD